MRATLGAAQLWLDYGRPWKRGREVFGDVVPWDIVWRTGANAATQFRTTHALRVRGKKLRAGLYSLTFFTPQGDLSIIHSADHTLTIAGRGMHYETGLPSVTEAALMQEELSILGPDDVYERVLNA